MTHRAIVIASALVFCIGGCSRNAGFRCENPDRYTGAEEVAPLTIPDDLDPPSEVEALRIPQTGSTTVASEPGASDAPQEGPADGDVESCTEAPPDFFQEGLPG